MSSDTTVLDLSMQISFFLAMLPERTCRFVDCCSRFSRDGGTSHPPTSSV